VQAQHGECKVPTHRAHHPAGAQDHAASTGREQLFNRLLPRGLAGALGPQRIAGLLGLVRAALPAVEHEIRAQLQ